MVARIRLSCYMLLKLPIQSELKSVGLKVMIASLISYEILAESAAPWARYRIFAEMLDCLWRMLWVLCSATVK